MLILRRACAAGILVLLGSVLSLAERAAVAEEAGPGALRAAEGARLLAAGDVDGAAAAWLEAARAEPRNGAYVERATLLRRVLAWRKVVAEQPGSPSAERAVVSLHDFYLQSGVPALAVAVDRDAHARSPTPATALRLAEAYLAAGENVEAANAAALHAATSARHAVLQAIALARLGRREDAARLAAGLAPTPLDLPPAEAYDRARLEARLGRADAALESLRLSLERTPAAAVPALRHRAQSDPDLASLAALPAFPQVLATESKVPQTCSGGSTCASCPNRGKCGGASR